MVINKIEKRYASQIGEKNRVATFYNITYQECSNTGTTDLIKFGVKLVSLQIFTSNPCSQRPVLFKVNRNLSFQVKINKEMTNSQ